MTGDTAVTAKINETIGTPYVSNNSNIKSSVSDITGKPKTIGEAITSNPNSVVKASSSFEDTFLDNFKYLIFFLALVIMLGTFANEKVLVWFLGLVLVGILITNYKVFTKIAL